MQDTHHSLTCLNGLLWMEDRGFLRELIYLIDYLHHQIINLNAYFTFRFADLGKRVTWRQEALDIKTALDMIKDSQKYLHDAAEAEKASEAAAQSLRVKPKGNRSFSDLL